MPGQKATEATRREQILKAAYDVALRRGIDGLTVRAVAAKARLSHGLVLFHFKRKDQLGLALLDRVIGATLTLRVPEDIPLGSSAPERLQALLRQEVHRLSTEPKRLRLLLEYWARGAHNAVIREKISAALDRYRMDFRSIAEEVLRTGAGRIRGATSAGLAAAMVSLIIGYPVQSMIDPDRFDVNEYLATAQGVLGQLARAA